MNKAVLISIRPEWCELIAKRIKTVEVRKTKPKQPTPFKALIYCTKDNADTMKSNVWKHNNHVMNGKIIGEFVCDKILPISVEYSDPDHRIANKEFPFTCLTDKQIMDYLGNGKRGYGWHISELVIYDEPKEIMDFYKPCIDEEYQYCQGCKHGHNIYPSDVETYEDLSGCCFDTECTNFLSRAPQSWCYVEEVRKKCPRINTNSRLMCETLL